MASLTTAERNIIKQATTILTEKLQNDGDKVILRDFGTFSRITKNARTARNPATGDTVQVPAKSTLKFKPAGKQIVTL